MSELKFKKIAPAELAGEYRIRMTLATDMLGTKPLSQKIAQEYLQAKMNKVDRMQRDLTVEDRIAKANEAVEAAEKALSIFYKEKRKGEDGKDAEVPLIMGYQVLGFLKEAAHTQLNDRRKLASNFYAGSLKGKIEEAFNVPDWLVYLDLPKGYDPYETVKDQDGNDVVQWKRLERPLRTEMRGVQMVSIAKSEIVPAGTVMEFTVQVRSDTIPTGTGKNSPKVDAHKLLEELLGEGSYRGIGQWRNGGYGRFAAEIAEL